MKKKVVCPSMCEVYTRTGSKDFSKAFAKIEFSDDGRLSICGVIGPMSNGDCRGNAGQCVDAIRAGNPADGWTAEMLKKFCDIWDEWHLNDTHPYCEHQKQLGWRELARKKVTLYHYMITTEAFGKKRDAEKAATDALRKRETFTPSEEQIMFATLPYGKESHVELSGDELTYYKPKKALYPGGQGPTEVTALGWLYQKQHPDGLLCRPCPVCGYKYGNGWVKEDVPQDVIDWLFSLPDTPVKPAWV